MGAEDRVAQGCLVIDNSSFWRMDREVPLVVPEVNADALHGIKKGIIANPNCSTAQLVVALKPLHDLAKIKRVVVATYQSVSGAGKEAMDVLFRQTRAVFVADPVEVEKFTKQIAFNVIPHIDSFLDSGYTKEEWKMTVETQKILDPDIQLIATCVRVPVFIGHSEAVNIEFEMPITAEKARAALRAAPGILVVDKREDGGYATPLEWCRAKTPPMSAASARTPRSNTDLSLWVVSDNLRKGAALNAVQIAECLINRKLLAVPPLMPKAYWIARVDACMIRRRTKNMSRPMGPCLRGLGCQIPGAWRQVRNPGRAGARP